MNYTERNISVPESVALGPLEASPQQSRRWTISHRAIAALAMLVDTSIIFLASILSGVIYNLEVFGRTGDIAQLAGFAAVVALLFITLARSGDFYTLRELLLYT